MTPFALEEEFRPIFRKRLLDSLTNWDLRDGKADWTPQALAAVIDVYLDDFLLFDVSKPTTDTSFFEIEKSTLHGKPYQTGGGRTVNANVIDIMLTWMVNNDREFLQGGATAATKPGVNTFPFLASPNTQIQTAVDSVELAASPDKVWALIGDFGAAWEPLIASIKTVGTGVGQIRVIETIDGKRIVERLEEIDNSSRSYRYAMLGGLQVTDYTGTLSVAPKGAGSVVQWQVQYWADGQPDIVIKTVVTTLLRTSLESLKARFGAS
jgi:carbon monoxide dehydrogenase subunit G